MVHNIATTQPVVTRVDAKPILELDKSMRRSVGLSREHGPAPASGPRDVADVQRALEDVAQQVHRLQDAVDEMHRQNEGTLEHLRRLEDLADGLQRQNEGILRRYEGVVHDRQSFAARLADLERAMFGLWGGVRRAEAAARDVGATVRSSEDAFAERSHSLDARFQTIAEQLGVAMIFVGRVRSTWLFRWRRRLVQTWGR